MDLAAVLRAARAESALSQVEVARRAGVTPQALSRWECGTRPVRADDADRVLAACDRDVRFTLVQRHTDTDELLRQLAATPVLDRMTAVPGLLMLSVLEELQATGVVRFSGAWAAAALGLPSLRPAGGVVISPRLADQAKVAAVLRSWSPVQLSEGRAWAVSWDDLVFERNPDSMWSSAVLGRFRVDIVQDGGPEHRLRVGDGSWRLVDPQELVPEHVDATTLDRWRRLT